MSRNYYSEINLHITWHTKDNIPVLFGDVERFAHEELRKRIMDTPNVRLHEIDGTDDHVHMAVSVPPTLTPSTWIGQLKGGSSHDVNRRIRPSGKCLQWQSGYGVTSFATSQLPYIKAYIRNQRTHHANGTTVWELEQVDQLDDDSQASDPA
jgi:putative transposase